MKYRVIFDGGYMSVSEIYDNGDFKPVWFTTIPMFDWGHDRNWFNKVFGQIEDLEKKRITVIIEEGVE